MWFAGDVRSIDFRITTINSVAVAGLTLPDFVVIFRRNNTVCSDTLTLLSSSAGDYTVQYIPSSVGHDYLELYNTANDVRVIDTEDITTRSLEFGDTTKTVNHNFPTTNALSVTQVLKPTDYKIYAYLKDDWASGLRDLSQTLGHSGLNSDGSWMSTITLVPGSYTIVILNSSDSLVINASLVI